jgi:hypothetical protein
MPDTSSVTPALFKHKTDSGQVVKRFEFDVVSDDDAGNAQLVLSDLHGFIVKYVTNPDAGTAPTAAWDMTLVGSEGEDVLAGGGVDRSNTATQQVIPTEPIRVDGDYTLTFANMGNSKLARVILHIVE